MSTVFLVRHGRTALNVDDRLRGHADPPLDQAGRAEVEQMALALALQVNDPQVRRVLSSPLLRARTTADIIATAVGSHVEVSDAFDDRDYGQWTGHPRSEVIEHFGSVDAAPGVRRSRPR